MASGAGEVLMTRRLCPATAVKISDKSNVDQGTSPILQSRISVEESRRVPDDDFFLGAWRETFFPRHLLRKRRGGVRATDQRKRVR